MKLYTHLLRFVKNENFPQKIFSIVVLGGISFSKIPRGVSDYNPWASLSRDILSFLCSFFWDSLYIVLILKVCNDMTIETLCMNSVYNVNNNYNNVYVLLIQLQ